MKLHANQRHEGEYLHGAVLQAAAVALAALVGLASVTGCCGPASMPSKETPALEREQESKNTAQGNLMKALKLALNGLDDISLQDVLFPKNP